jgi:hypothetical protein
VAMPVKKRTATASMMINASFILPPPKFSHDREKILSPG